MPFFGRTFGCPNPLPFAAATGCPMTASPRPHRWLPSLRDRSRGSVRWLPSPVSSRRHTSVSRRRCRPFAVIGCPTPSPGDGTPVCRSPGPVGPSTPFHADPVNRAIAGRRRTSSEFAVGVLTRLLPGRSSARGLRLPGDSVLRSMWLLAPTRIAFASWIGSVFRVASPEGLTRQTRSLDPGLRALSGTRDTFALVKPQVKRYF
jgi:hypothetical protein